MPKKRLLILLLPLLVLMIVPLAAKAATITGCTFDREVYEQGETGYLTIAIYNDKDNTIRVNELTATIDYYYTDGNIYIQTFFTTTTLPVEIQQGQSSTFHIPFSLPTNVAPGYTNLLVKAETELWNDNSETWGWSDHPTYEPKLYIESPYKQLFEDQEQLSGRLQTQLQELQAVNNTTTTVMYLLIITAMICIAITAFLILLNRKPRTIPQPTA